MQGVEHSYRPSTSYRHSGHREQGGGSYIALAATLVDEARGVVEDTEHGHEARRLSTGARDVATRRPDAVGGLAYGHVGGKS